MSDVDIPSEQNAETPIDLVGGPWAVIESDPGVFTMLIQKLGVRGCEATEIYSLDADSLGSMGGRIHGLLLCSTYQDEDESESYQETGANQSWDETHTIWFANQLISDACATQGLLNILFNCAEIQVGDHLQRFRDFTQGIDPQMRGLAMSNDRILRSVHNSMARPSDVREALSTVAIDTARMEKKKKASRSVRTTPRKKKSEATTQDIYHYLSYVPFDGKVWQLDGLASSPLEVGILEPNLSLNTPEGQRAWLELAQPAINFQIEKIQNQGGDIRVNLLAITNSSWEKHSDEFELLRRERIALQRRLDDEAPGWSDELNDPTLLHRSRTLFDDKNSHNSQPFDPAFGFRKQERQVAILKLPSERLSEQWQQRIEKGEETKVLLDDELAKAKTWQTEHIKRTHDYEPFLRELLKALKSEGLIETLLNPTEE